MKNISKNFLWAMTALIATALIFSFIIGSSTEPEKFTLSDLADKINSGEVESIIVSGNNLEISLTDGSKAEAKKEFEASLTETLVNYGVSTSQLKDVALEVAEESGGRFWAGILIPALLPLLILIFFFWFLFRSAKGGANQVMGFGKSNLKAVVGKKDRITFNDVAGLKEEKQELSEIVEFLKTPQKFLKMGAKIPRGVLLMGAPGSGKTLLARAVAGESGVPFFYISASEFVEMFVGVGAARIRDTFQTAKRASPSILFIDEIDAVGRQRGAGLGGGHDEREQTLNQILVEMDGFDRDSKVIVLAATNRPDILDQALLRPGRFDRRVVINLPDIKEREAILALHAQNKPVEKSVNFHKVAIRTPGFSGADLENILNEAAILAARENKKIIAQAEIFEAIEKVLLGPEKKGRVISDNERKITAYHEAGHALVAASLKDADPVYKISIISRGHAGGYTLKLPIEERRLKTKKQFLADLATLMGGFVAEQVTFKDITTGASNDLERATEISRQLVTKYGMSEKLGPVSLGATTGSIFLGRDMMGEKNYSDQTATEIDREISGFLERAYNLAKKILVSRKKVLEKIAKTLIEKETLEQEEFDAMIKSFKLKPLAI